jgi:hypothetical protein
MKVIENYRGNAGNQIAAFKNEFITQFWRTKVPVAVNTDDYYTINRALSDVIDKMVLIVQAEYTLPRHADERLGDDREKLVLSQLTRLVADQLFKSERIPVELTPSLMYGDKTYRLTVPVIALKEEK